MAEGARGSLGTALRALLDRTPRPVGVPRWPATVAVLAFGGIFLALSGRYRVGPPWLVLAVVAVLIALVWMTRLRGYHRLTRLLAQLATALITLAVASSAALLVYRLTQGGVVAVALLRDAALIWVANIICFALWYWEIDGGGPAQRHPGHHSSADFAFPQQQQADDGLVEGWSPGFIDYLFLAFNTATAFSPTDTLVLSRRAKLLMMLQSLISLVVVAVLAARAINLLGS